MQWYMYNVQLYVRFSQKTKNGFLVGPEFKFDRTLVKNNQVLKAECHPLTLQIHLEVFGKNEARAA